MLKQAQKLCREQAFIWGWWKPHKSVTQEQEARDPVHTPPEAQPITSIHALLSWEPGALPFAEMLRGTTPLQAAPRRNPDQDRPRLLVCHDLGGNYSDDAFPQGTCHTDYYRLNHWSWIDMFCYFSHAMVAIPPPGWINAAHKHGVPVLGTFITEWDDGALRCMQMFISPESAEEVARQLASIAQHYRFEGWLINIENMIQQHAMPNLLHFIRTLRDLMHAAVPGSQVIWYDAVTTSGHLQWQDTVNDLNRPFLDAADGIFVNYSWKAGTPSQAAAAAGPRRRDVYMGIDVFGRKTFGGGGMACNVALQAAHAAGLSAALFAPGWVWEQTARGNYAWQDQQFWDSIEAACGKPHPALVRLPFVCTFNTGAGQRMYSEGRLLSPQPWFNMSLQGVQPLRQQAAATQASQAGVAGAQAWQLRLPGRAGTCTAAGAWQPWLQAQVSDEIAFEGGSCLRLQGSMSSGQPAVSVELFTAALTIPSPGLTASFTCQLTTPDVTLELWVWVEPSVSGDSQPPATPVETVSKAVCNAGRAAWQKLVLPFQGQAEDSAKDHFSSATIPDGCHRLQAQESQLLAAGWTQCRYVLPSSLPDFAHLTVRSIEVACSTTGSSASTAVPLLAYVGELVVVQQGLGQPPAVAAALTCGDTTWSTCEFGAMQQDAGNASSSALSGELHLVRLTTTLAWQARHSGHFRVSCRPLPASSQARQSWTWIGDAVSCCYRVTDLPLPALADGLEFVVQAADRLGRWPPASTADTLKLLRP